MPDQVNRLFATFICVEMHFVIELSKLSLKLPLLSQFLHEKPTLHSEKATTTSLAKFLKTTLLSSQGNIPLVTTLILQSQTGAKAAR